MTFVHVGRETEAAIRQAMFGGALDAVPLTSLGEAYTEVELDLVAEDRALWCYLKPRARPSFTAALLRDLHAVQATIEGLASTVPGREPMIRTFVLASRTPDVFSLGGDLTLFSEHIRTGDRDGLRRYAHSCVEIAFRNWSAYNGSVVTIGLAQGDALGGGFEGLLSCDVIVAERRARFGLPEILFNLFPGMGATSFLTWRLGAAKAQALIMSGQVYTAEQMHALGVVDVLADDGEGERAVREYIQRHAGRRNAHAAIYKARRRVSPVSLAELRDVADIWVDAALRLTEADLRRMAHLAAAQDRNRRRAASTQAAAA
jgi:DSF synthase